MDRRGSFNLLILAIILLIVAGLNIIIGFKIENQKITGAVTTGKIAVCFKHSLSITLNSTFLLTDNANFSTNINYTNPDSSILNFSDDASFFDINSAGSVAFTPTPYDVGNHYITFSVFETNGICNNDSKSTSATFIINGTSQLSVYDETDPKGGNYLRHRDQNIKFFANYSTRIGTPLNLTTANCSISFNVSNIWSTPTNMSYNQSSGLYEYIRNFSANSNYTWLVNCSSWNLPFENKSRNDTVTLGNLEPVAIANYPNISWNMNTIFFGPSLKDYFMDPDGDPLNFSTLFLVSNIQVAIDNVTAVVKFSPQTDFFGNRSVTFVAEDGFGGRAEGNLVILSVQFVQVSSGGGGSSSGGGGGGGGGGGAGSSGGLPCEEIWDCKPYGPCQLSGIQNRVCTDLAECATFKTIPITSKNCTYYPTCDDNIRNGNESAVDCGGICPKCPTCDDGIINQGEVGIDCEGPCDVKCPTCVDGIKNGQESGLDCGGICSACPNCLDGIKNSDETDVDCGGSCGPCKEKTQQIQSSGTFMNFAIGLIIFFILAIIGLGALRIIGKPRPKPISIQLPQTISQLLAKTISQLHTLRKQKNSNASQIAAILRPFFMGYFKIEKEFSYEELASILENSKGKRKIIELAKSLSLDLESIAYNKSQESILPVIDKALNLVELCAKQQAENTAKDLVSEFETKLLTLDDLIANSKYLEAKQLYLDASKTYETMGKSQKEVYYPRLTNIHNKLTDMLRKLNK